MQIEVFSQSDTRATLIEKAVRFYSKYLKISRTNCKVFVVPRRSMRTKENRIGCANKFFGNDYLIRIDNKLSVHKLLSVLAHEMVHVKQMIRGEIQMLKYRNGRVKYMWHGAEVRLPYHKQPWEIEAYTMELTMVNALMNEVHKNMVKKK
jgi:hypothetical protein